MQGIQSILVVGWFRRSESILEYNLRFMTSDSFIPHLDQLPTGESLQLIGPAICDPYLFIKKHIHWLRPKTILRYQALPSTGTMGKLYFFNKFSTGYRSTNSIPTQNGARKEWLVGPILDSQSNASPTLIQFQSKSNHNPKLVQYQSKSKLTPKAVQY